LDAVNHFEKKIPPRRLSTLKEFGLVEEDEGYLLLTERGEEAVEWYDPRGDYGVSNHIVDFYHLNRGEKDALLAWVYETFQAGPVESESSYSLKHYFEAADGGFYVSNGQFKGAMLRAGFEPTNSRDLNWCFMLDKEHPNGPRRP
jgi:hypothetical protein